MTVEPRIKLRHLDVYIVEHGKEVIGGIGSLRTQNWYVFAWHGCDDWRYVTKTKTRREAILALQEYHGI